MKLIAKIQKLTYMYENTDGIEEIIISLKKQSSYVYQHENGKVGVKTVVEYIPVDDLAILSKEE